MYFYAHSVAERPTIYWQTLSEHLFEAARRAADMGRTLGLERAAFLAGLLHDLGKYTADFQRRLTGADIRVDHSTAGAQAVIAAYPPGPDRIIAELIAYAIAGHHAGLPDRQSDAPSCLDRRLEQPLPPLDPVWRAELEVAFGPLTPDFARSFARADLPFGLSVMGRMIFSCLVDADFKDTEAFYARQGGYSPDRDWPTLASLLPQFIADFDAHMATFAADDREVNHLRRDVLAHVRGKAVEKPGLFTLTVPTGGGKTLASLGFALDHARAHGHRRIIYAIPFTSVIDQTVEVFREVLGEDHVLPHHAAVEDEQKGRDGPPESRDKLKQAMEDWAAPVVVTTNVQLFESLFAARPSRARKLHNIAGSIIILDEAQTLPRPLLLPCMRMLDELARNYGCTIVLCTATQPALDKRKLAGGLPLEGRELAPDPHGLSSRLRRARIVHGGEMGNEELVEALANTPQGLIIVNSRRHALELFRDAAARGLEGLVHLTTRQCPAHRRQILDDVRARLKSGAPCRVVATSLIEAGVDADFPRVWRAEAGLDQIIQAAGRCNREGRRPLADSIVTVFSAPDYPPPAEIRGLIGDMRRMMTEHDDLLSLDAIEAYFGEVYWRMGDRLDEKRILALFDIEERAGRTNFAYRTAAEAFRMIESGLVPVIIPRDEKAREAVEQLGIEAIPSGGLARALQPYVVQVPPKARDLLIRNGHVAFRRPDLRGDQFAVLRNESLYQEDCGLIWEDAKYLVSDDCIV